MCHINNAPDCGRPGGVDNLHTLSAKTNDGQQM